MTPQKNELEPQLQPPGAGLPFYQRILLKAWIGPVVSKRTSPAQCRKTYEQITEKLIAQVSKIPNDLRSVKVLVDPLVGLEDSSRYWSLNGLLEHLVIVSKGMESVILSLSAGTVPPGKADTAKVKPKSHGHDFLPEFIEYAPQLIHRIDDKLNQSGMNFSSNLKYRHPWFGEINAKQWYWLLGIHQGIHYRQAKEIIRGLSLKS